MAKAFKCDNCGQIFEGVAGRRTPVVKYGEIQIVVALDVTKNGESGFEFCNNCLHAFLWHVAGGLEEWPQEMVGMAGGVDVVDSADLLKGTSLREAQTGLHHMRVLENEDMILEEDE